MNLDFKAPPKVQSKALAMLQQGEWSMGNGQCPDCHGCQPSEWWCDHIPWGHKPDCARAAAMQELGGKPLMISEGQMTRRTFRP